MKTQERKLTRKNLGDHQNMVTNIIKLHPMVIQFNCFFKTEINPVRKKKEQNMSVVKLKIISWMDT